LNLHPRFHPRLIVTKCTDQKFRMSEKVTDHGLNRSNCISGPYWFQYDLHVLR
jgi:hypothetical protein